MKHLARTTTAAAAAAGLMIGLSGCGPSAPDIAQPTANSVTTSDGGSTTSSGPATSTDTSTTPSSTSTTDPGSSASATNVCTATTSSIGPTPSSGTPSRQFGATANITTDNSDVKVAIKVDAPRAVGEGSSPPSAGTKLVAVQISATLLAGTSDYVGSTSFNMFDGKGNKCTKSYTNALPADQRWTGASLNPSKKSATGSLVYEVPQNQVVSALVVAYNGQFRQIATVQWTG